MTPLGPHGWCCPSFPLGPSGTGSGDTGIPCERGLLGLWLTDASPPGSAGPSVMAREVPISPRCHACEYRLEALP